MKVLISSIGSRGDVQPILALAQELLALGHEPRLCVAPNFKDWVESHGVECVPVGPDLRQLTSGSAPRPIAQITMEQRRQYAALAVHSQFPAITEAARDCDLVVAAGALQFAARSICEAMRVPYAFAVYCPAVLPSPDHPPARIDTHFPQVQPAGVNRTLWADEELRWNDLFGPALNEERGKLGLPPVDSVQRHIFTDQPWLAADAALSPKGATNTLHIAQTGAWLLKDESPLPDELERFLEGGKPPCYFGLGSMRAAEATSRTFIECARALGLRAIISRGWANLSLVDGGGDCLSIGDVAHEKLFSRVAAVIHHGGAGTTTAAARAGCPQVVCPRNYDQFYWAHRVATLRIGTSGPLAEQLDANALRRALEECLRPETAGRANQFAKRVALNGAAVAAKQLVSRVAGP